MTNPSKADLGGNHSDSKGEELKVIGLKLETTKFRICPSGIVYHQDDLGDWDERYDEFEDVSVPDAVVEHLMEYPEAKTRASASDSFGQKVAQWFDDRKITENGNFNGQRHKLNEELSELDKSIHFGDNKVVDMREFKDGIGDCAVVLAGIAHMGGMTFEQCCEHAWNEIKDRTGHLNEEGIFVKDELTYRDLETGETVEEGDEIFVGESWIEPLVKGNKVGDQTNAFGPLKYRRPL